MRFFVVVPSAHETRAPDFTDKMNGDDTVIGAEDRDLFLTQWVFPGYVHVDEKSKNRVEYV